MLDSDFLLVGVFLDDFQGLSVLALPVQDIGELEAELLLLALEQDQGLLEVFDSDQCYQACVSSSICVGIQLQN